MEFHLVLSPLLHFSGGRAGNQICRYRDPLLCYGNEGPNTCVPACACPGRGRAKWKGEMRVCLSEGSAFTRSNSGVEYTDPIERSNVDHNKSTFHPANISTNTWLCLHTQIYPLNKIFHPDFRSTHWKYQHSGRGALVRSCPYYGNPETRNRWWWWLVECWRKPLHPPRPPFH